jgi:tripartite-type tricarboxylate transporter receptor subunit TctC
MNLCRRELAVLTLVGSALPIGSVASAIDAAYPQRPITLVVGSTAGGGADGLARLLAKHMSDDLGQTVLVNNRPGAAGNVAAEYVARAAPDGYTLYIGIRPNTIHKVMYGHLKFDMSIDLAPVGLLATVPTVLVAGANGPMEDIKDVVGLAKAYPGAVSCASTGVGSTAHLMCELFQQETGTRMLHVAYRGSAPAFIDVIGGRVDFLIAALPSAMPHIRARTARPIAVLSPQRSAILPDVPTVEEMGLSGIDLDAWFGLMVPAGTPPGTIDRLNESINKVLLRREVQEAFTSEGYVAPLRPNTPETLGRLIAEETERWTTIVRERNIKPR